MSHLGAKPRESAFVAAPGLRVGRFAEPVARFRHGELLKGGSRLFRNVNGDNFKSGAFGFRVVGDRAVAVVITPRSEKNGPGQRVSGASAIVFSCGPNAARTRGPAQGPPPRPRSASVILSLSAGVPAQPSLNKSNRRGLG